jgi:LytS/YehU family sensor histidine kinase
VGSRCPSVRSMRAGSVRSLLATVVWWTLYGLVAAGQMLAMDGPGGEVMSARRALALGLASGWLWIPLTLGLLWCVERYPLQRGDVLRPLLVFALASAAVIALRAIAVAVLNPWVGWYQRVPGALELAWTSFLNNIVMLFLIIGAAHAWWYARRAAERERQAEQLQARLVATRLDALRTQLNPHFLFNALNSIAEMVHRDAAAADRMLVGLGELLRSSLEQRDQQVPLGEELRLLRHYLEIESHRLGERLRLQWDVDAAVGEVLVPPLLLQPLAENAIVHAIATRTVPGHLRIGIGALDDRLLVEVEDDGGLPAAASGRVRGGTGLANLRDRLECLYGTAFVLEVAANGRGGTTARLSLPLQRAPLAVAA